MSTRPLILLVCMATTINAKAVTAQTIRVDGETSEWAGIAPAATAPAGPGALRAIAVTADDQRVYFLLTFTDSINLQGAPYPVRLTVHGAGPVLGEPDDGFAGGSLDVDFSPPPAAIGSAVRFPGDTVFRSPYDADLRYAPTHASDRFEIALSRTAAGMAPVAGDTIDGSVRILPDGPPLDFRAVVPRTSGRSVPIPIPAPPTAEDLVVLNWNVGDAALLRMPDPYRRIIAGTGAQVLLLDELGATVDEAAVRALLPPGEWNIVYGPTSGRQRTAVVTTLPTEPSRAVARVSWPDSVDAIRGLPMRRQLRNDLANSTDGLPVTGAIVTFRGTRILFVPMDLSCCGTRGNVDDRARVMAAAAIAEAVRESLRTEDVDAVVMAGDLNLVGSLTPLDRLVRGTAPDGEDLVAAELRSPGDGSYATWRAPGPFPPGRLDWVLYSPNRLTQTGGVVLDAGALDAATLRRYGIKATDTDVTDHLPLLTVLRLR